MVGVKLSSLEAKMRILANCNWHARILIALIHQLYYVLLLNTLPYVVTCVWYVCACMIEIMASKPVPSGKDAL